MLRMFGPSFALTGVAFAAALALGGPRVLLLVFVLSILEISLSFDNAVVNAKVLQRMKPLWQTLFLTVGILIAVFGMRLVLPIVIVVITAGLGPIEAFDLAVNDPEAYQHNMEAAKEAIYAFGGMFLLMIFLDFVIDEERDVHWLRPLEVPLAKVGKLNQVSVLIALLALYGASQLAAEDKVGTVMVSGVFGLIVYLAVSGLDSLLSDEVEHMDDDEETRPKVGPDGKVTQAAATGGFAAFLYLEMLDASFSLDGVIGAFAISNEILVIALGLGIGAFWVRSMTIYLVRKGTLAEYIYLEHGAHWAIGALATIMLLGMKYHISEYITGIGGVVFIGLAVASSVVAKRRRSAAEPEPEPEPVGR
ncbi:DUF475 domain-containing protein [Nocardioides sp. TF02-7]|uniref:DUF475 domain-containing protein n=1 Tax=Nocardioides sp. TF02-7 TaxID=2917724 RepID=UPI001F0529E2|nr:DUF475 domain-containing protein [Nocardioides sp. TF02-7]UMG92611.1 DUF475 domain-containing protein [Nocardioides sp. TF02-7]